MIDPGTAISALDFCFTYGKKLIELCQTWRDAPELVTESITKVEVIWNKTRLQLEFIGRIADTLDSEHVRIFDDTVGVLSAKLQLSISKVQDCLRKQSQPKRGFLQWGSKVSRTKFVMAKDTIDSIIIEVEEWHRRFDPTWFLVMRIANPRIDQELSRVRESQAHGSNGESGSHRRHHGDRAVVRPLALANELRSVLRPDSVQEARGIFLPPQTLQTIDIAFSSAKAAQRPRDPKWYIVDTMACRPNDDEEALEKDIRELAMKLTRADPEAFGLLGCKGVIRCLDPMGRHVTGFDFVFRAPEGMEVLQSLRQMLINADSPVSLSRRVRIAKGLAKSVSYVHTFNFVHKNIRPESILLFEDTDSTRSSTFLVGFDNFRGAEASTRLIGDNAWERNVYRHPSRTGENPEVKYKMQHDIYSLGVCLLEIGIWSSFVGYSEDVSPRPLYGKPYNDFIKWLKDTEPSLVNQAPTAGYLALMSDKLKDYLVFYAKNKLPQRMGDRFSEVVVTCLTCLDVDNDDFGDENIMTDQDEILVGVRFIEKVLVKLNEISI